MNYDWRAFLEKWSAALIEAAKRDGETLPAEVLESGWMGYAGATEAQIAAAEARLGVRLPPSYREFLQVSNGWRTFGTFIWKLWPVEELEFYRTQHPRDAEDYDNDGPDKDPNSPLTANMMASLELSADGDAAWYLLDPLVVTADGEWRAYFMANWLPGAERYSSFWNLMQHEYERFFFLDASRVIIEAEQREVEELAEAQHTSWLESLANRIGDLTEQLRTELPHRRIMPNAPQNLAPVSLQAFTYYWADAVQDVIQRVQTIIEQNLPPDELLNTLQALADQIDREIEKLERMATNTTNINVMQLAKETVSEREGRLLGKRKAGATIRQFLTKKAW